MAWPQGRVSAEDILGMSKDDLKTKLESAATKDDITAAVNAANEENKTALQAIQEKLNALTAPPPAPASAEIDPTTAILTDPNDYIRAQTQGINQTALQAGADVQEMRARQTYGGVFAKYGEELLKTAQNFSLDQRAKPGFWDFHIRSFMGDKYVRGETEGSYPSTLGASSYTSGVNTPEDPNKGLDPNVAEFLKNRGIPLDKAAQLKRHMIDNGEPVSIDTYRKTA